MPPQDDPLKDADRRPPDCATDERQENQQRVTQQRSSSDLDGQMGQNEGNGRRKHPLDRDKESHAHMDVPLISEENLFGPANYQYPDRPTSTA
jgi:hypothetical protein